MPLRWPGSTQTSAMSMIVKLLRRKTHSCISFMRERACSTLTHLFQTAALNNKRTLPWRIGTGEVYVALAKHCLNDGRRNPTREELNALLATLQEEELMARGPAPLVSTNDTIVRRRLAQKLSSSVAETSRIADPAEKELRRFFDAHRAIPTEAQVSLEQVFFGPESARARTRMPPQS